MFLISFLDKINFNKKYNNYTLIIRKQNCTYSCFSYCISAFEAKNISLAKNNLTSNKLNIYDMYIDMLDILKYKIKKSTITLKNKKINSSIILKSDNKEFTLNSSILDSLILSMKTHSPLFVEEELFINSSKEIYFENEKFKKNTNKNITMKSSLKKLNSSLKKLIDKEKYELAAVIRDRIKDIENN